MYGVDLGAMVRQRRVRELLDLVDELPAASRLSEARATDPRLAWHLLAQREEAQDLEWRPRVRDYGLQELLLLRLCNLTASLAGARDDDLLDGPRTAVDDLIERARTTEALYLIAMATPGRASEYGIDMNA